MYHRPSKRTHQNIFFFMILNCSMFIQSGRSVKTLSTFTQHQCQLGHGVCLKRPHYIITLLFSEVVWLYMIELIVHNNIESCPQYLGCDGRLYFVVTVVAAI